jgi:hypothetical protein
MDHRTSTVRGLESLSGLDTTIGAIGVGDRPRQIPHSGWRKPALFLCNLAQVRRAHDALVRAAEKYEEWQRPPAPRHSRRDLRYAAQRIGVRQSAHRAIDLQRYDASQTFDSDLATLMHDHKLT